MLLVIKKIPAVAFIIICYSIKRRRHSYLIRIIFPVGDMELKFSISGLYTVAHDLKMEWAVIKGVSDFADDRKSDTDSWRPYASVMAASLMAHILSDPNIFKHDWENYESTY